MYKEIVFNGKYMIKKGCRGVQRYTKEILHAIDQMVEPGEIKVLVPHSKEKLNEKFNNIEIVQYGGRITHFFWQNLAFQWYIWTHKALAVCLSDGVPFFQVGILAVHDVRFLQDYKKIKSIKKKIRALYGRLSFYIGIHNAKQLVTVSEFSKREIMKAYRVEADRITVCHNAWQHLLEIPIDMSIFSNLEGVQKGEYYFLLGGSEDNKNMYWVMRIALKYPNRKFVLAGPPNLYFSDMDGINLTTLSNCLHVGYVSDGQVRALMQNCRMFLFPSLYEGFGIPPMEALSVGAKVAISNATCLPEIYQDYVPYFDPMDYDVDLDRLEQEFRQDAVRLLDQYSWEKTGREILKLINQIK